MHLIFITLTLLHKFSFTYFLAHILCSLYLQLIVESYTVTKHCSGASFSKVQMHSSDRSLQQYKQQGQLISKQSA